MSSPGRLAIVAGAGALPPLAIDAAKAAGWQVRVLCLQPRKDLEHEDPFIIKVSRPDQVLREIKVFQATHVCAVGGTHVSDREREKLAAFAGAESESRGDAKLSKLGAALLKMLGIPFIGVHEIVADLLAPEGVLGAVEPGDELKRVAAFGFDLARKAGELDLGQALVVSGSRVVAAEDIAGTDALLERCRMFRDEGLVGDGSARMVLAKTSKPGQPIHIDLPAIGPKTIEGAAAAEISAIVVEAGRTLLVERETLIALADKSQIAVIGMKSDA